MRLLLDEMLSPAIARQLRDQARDVQAINGDRAELRAMPDAEIVRRMRVEHRVIVTNNVKDFQPIHAQLMARGEDHSGMVFTYDDTMPRNKAGIEHWVEVLGTLLDANPNDDALANRILHLP